MVDVATKVKSYGKIAVAALGFILAALNDHMDVVPVQYRGYVTTAIAIAGLLGAYHTPYVAAPRKPRRKRKVAKAAGTSQVPIVQDVGTAHIPVVPDVPGKHEA